MCHPSVVESVKRRMVRTRRELLTSAPAALGGAALAQAPVAAEAAIPAGARLEDLTHELHRDFPTYDGIPGVNYRRLAKFDEHGYNMNEFVVMEHTGTHLDAPLHYAADGKSVAELEIGSLLCPLAVVDIRDRAGAGSEAVLSPDDLRAWIARHGPIPDGACVAMLTGWERHLGTPRFRGADDQGVQHYPGVHPEAAAMLLEETTAAGIAVDTLSLDVGSSTEFETHYAWLGAGRWGLECTANLARLPAAGATIFVGVPRLRAATGFPARVIAFH